MRIRGGIFVWGLGLILMAASPSLAAAPNLDRGGLSMNYTKVVVGNLPIGNVISMSQIANAPLIVGNNYDIPIFVNIKVTAPPKEFPDYEVLPDLSWISVDAHTVTIPAHGEMKVDLKVHLPNDEKLFGKKYRVGINVNTQGNPAITGLKYGYSLTGSFLFSVAPGRNDAALASAIKNPVDADYEVYPPRLDFWNVKPGTELDLINDKQERPTLKNTSKKKHTYFLLSVDAGHTIAAVDEGCQFSGHPDDLTLPDDEITLGAGTNKVLNYKIKVPADIDFSKGPLAYLVSVKSGKAKGIERFLTIYLWGGSKPVQTKK
jgi:hypothetical protein